ncbi:hypothetical protein DCAR_0100622 [Daucus carota subsp. sativus]|uniref:MATH domain-containing protein n=1 Tax=Daucus carota subsp. sativus TaxID=79200 RepID=A0AAF0W4I3_DAUCS|nr:hypothetical protein DCAR_0100622 [Daucus carota subsp. sativus]
MFWSIFKEDLGPNFCVLRILRDAPPAHYSLRIEPFSGFTNLGIDKYESDAFDVGGYTW